MGFSFPGEGVRGRGDQEIEKKKMEGCSYERDYTKRVVPVCFFFLVGDRSMNPKGFFIPSKVHPGRYASCFVCSTCSCPLVVLTNLTPSF